LYHFFPRAHYTFCSAPIGNLDCYFFIFNNIFNITFNIIFNIAFEFNIIFDVVFDFNIIKSNTGNGLADSVVNEIWPLLRLFWRTRGAFKMELNFDEHIDTVEFSNFLGSPFNARLLFEIDNNAKWKADFKFDFKQPENYWHHHSFANTNSNASKRIEIFARKSKFPKKTLDEGWNDLQQNYVNMDLSFDRHYVGEGQW
jgi:hypothetical protein